MAVSAFFHGIDPTVAANITTAAAEADSAAHAHGGSARTVNVVESLLPLFGLRGLAPLFGLISSSLGADPTNLLTFLGLAWALNRLLRQLYSVCYGLVSEHFMSSIHVSSSDDIYLHLMKWLAAQPRMVNSRSLTAETVSRTAWDEAADESTVSRDQSGRYLNFSNQEARSVSQ